MNKYELLSISPDDQFSKIIDHYRLLCKYFTKDNETDEEDTKYPLDFTKEDIDQAFCSFVKSEKQTPMLELLKREIYICGDEERKNDDELKKEIIENNDAYPLLVCACAGAGKTTTMVLKIVYLIKKLGYLPKEIVAFTFTEKAANELKQRVTMEISNPEPVNNPDSLVKKIQAEMRGMSYDGKDLNDLYLGTIHSFCFQLLKTYRKDLSSCEIVEDGELKLIVYKNFQILELTKNLPFHRKISKPLGGDKVKSNIDAYLRFINMMNEENVYLSNETRIPIPVEFETLFQKYQDVIIGKYKRIDFGSILRIFVNELRTNDELREYVKANIKVLIVDEYQDVNKIQEILVEEFYKLGTKIIVVGDDDQAIYQFRGCDEKFIVEFDKRYANTKKVILANNYRSTPHVILTAHQIVDNGFYPGERIEKEFKSAKKLNFPSEKNDIKKIGFSDVSELVNFVVRQIKILHTKNNIPYSEIAILGRGNKDIKIFKEALTSQNIPFSLKINLFEETEDKDLEFFLEWVKFFKVKKHEKDLLKMEKNDDFILDVKNKLGDYVEKQQLKSLEQLIIDTYQNPEKILSNFSSLIDKNSLCFVFLNAYSETINEFVEHCSTQKTKVPEIGIALLKIITEFCFIEEWMETGIHPKIYLIKELFDFLIDEEKQKRPAILFTKFKHTFGLDKEQIFGINEECDLLRKKMENLTDVFDTENKNQKLFPYVINNFFYKILNFIKVDDEEFLADLGIFNTLIINFEKINCNLLLNNKLFLFNEYLKNIKFDCGDDSNEFDTVKLMTMHSSKGLEFEAVFLFPTKPISDEKIQLEHYYNKYWLKENKNISFNLEYYIEDKLNIEKFKDENVSERKLFYVAATRAKRFLCILFEEKNNNKILQNIVSANEDTFDFQSEYKFVDNIGKKEEKVLVLSYSSIKDFLDCETKYRLVDEYGFSGEQIDNANLGNYVHNMISCYVQEQKKSSVKLTAMEEESIIDSIVDKKALAMDWTSEETESLKTMFVKFIKLLNSLNVFDHQEIDINSVLTEHKFKNNILKNCMLNGSIDFLFIKQNTVYIIDFKTGSLNNASEKQLQLYALMASELFPSYDIAVGFLTSTMNGVNFTKYSKEEIKNYALYFQQISSKIFDVSTAHSFAKHEENSNKCQSCPFINICHNKCKE